MTTQKPMTAKEFMHDFEQQVQNHGANFFFNGCRELLTNLRGWGLEQNQDSVDLFLCDCLQLTRDDPLNPPSIDDVRKGLKAILSLDSDDR